MQRCKLRDITLEFEAMIWGLFNLDVIPFRWSLVASAC